MRLLVLFITIGFFSQLHAQTNISAPQTLSKDNETYVLTQNIVTNGTAFTISGNNIIFDLNSYVITYNNQSNGAGIVVNGSNNKVRNGFLIQGADQSGTSPAVRLNGTGHTVSFLGIKVNGVVNAPEQYAAGIEAYSSRTTIHHVYIENSGDTNNISYSPRGIHVDHRTTAGFTINDNIIVDSHLGIHFDFVGLNTKNPEKSRVFNNYIQHKRRPGTKAPYGIQLAKTRNVDVYNNQIISDEGRGIMCDGYGQGVLRGTDFNNIYGNTIDVEYRVTASSGSYVENNLYGIRDRYSSGNNKIFKNTIIVNNEAGGVSTGLFIGSDSTDNLMTGLQVTDNTVIGRDKNSSSSAIRYAYAKDLLVTSNQYLADNFSINDWAYGIDTLTVSNNSAITTISYTPAKTTGLQLKRFFNSYVLTWNDNNEAQTLEYVLYKDGSQMDISTRGGTFFVDGNVSGTHTYTVAAKNLNGQLGPQSDSVSTDGAASGWAASALQPLPPQNIQITMTN